MSEVIKLGRNCSLGPKPQNIALSCNIFLADIAKAQGFQKVLVDFVDLHFETLTVMVPPEVKKLWENMYKSMEGNSSIGIGIAYLLSKLHNVWLKTEWSLNS